METSKISHAIETSKFLRQFVETPKWLVIESVINAASENGNRIKLVICTNDGGKAAGLPHGSVKEAFVVIDVTPKISTPFLQADNHSKVICCEVKIEGTPKVLRLPVGVIKAIKIDGVQLPHIFPCWPPTADATAYDPSPVFEGRN